MEIIGGGEIRISRVFVSNEWRKYELTGNQYKPNWNAPVPTDSLLEIKGIFYLDHTAREDFKIQSFELMTNFAAADFAGRLSMGFTEVSNNEGYISFRFCAPSIKTNWTPEAVVKLHYMESKTGRKYTSYFKCRLNGLVRSADGVYNDDKFFYFKIKNPNSHTYSSSDQASLEGTSQVASIPLSQRFREPAGEQAASRGKRKATLKTCPNCHSENSADYNYCMECGYSFTQASASQTTQQPPPQVSHIETPASQIPQIIFEPYEEPERKVGCLRKFGKLILTIVVIAVILFILLWFIATFG